MSNISKLTEALKKSTEELQKHTKEKLQGRFNEFEQIIDSNLKEQQSAIESYTDQTLTATKKAQEKYISEIESNTERLINEVRKVQRLKAEQLEKKWSNWTIALISISVLSLIAFLVLMYLANGKLDEMKMYQRSAEIYKKEAKNLVLETCSPESGGEFTCVGIDRKYRNEAWKNESGILLKIIN
mgnify:CR=1 FL=1